MFFGTKFFKDWADISYFPNSAVDYANQVLWFNPFIKINENVIFYKLWSQKGVDFIKDLLDDNGNFLSFTSFLQKIHDFTQPHRV